jgi:hypothetical protein
VVKRGAPRGAALRARVRLCAHPALMRCACLQRGWTMRGDVIDFSASAASGEPAIPAASLINHTLAYAREMERII